MVGYYVKLPSVVAKSVGVSLGDIVMISSRRAYVYAWVKSVEEGKMIVSYDVYLTLGAPVENVLVTPVRRVCNADEVAIRVEYPKALEGDILKTLFKMVKSLRLIVSRNISLMIYVPPNRGWARLSFNEVKPYGPALITEFTKIVLR